MYIYIAFTKTNEHDENNENMKARSTMKTKIISLKWWGEIMVTRRMGENIRREIVSDLSAGDEPESLLLDFSGLSIMDYSCADELVARLAVELQNSLHGDRFLLLVGLDETLRENVTVALKQRGLALPYLQQGSEPSLLFLGDVKPYLQSALELLYTRGELTARDLADSEDIAINTASNRLVELAKSGLAYRHSDRVASGGKQYQYLSILPSNN